MSSSISHTASSIRASAFAARRRRAVCHRLPSPSPQNAPTETLPGTLGALRAPRSLWSNAWRQFRRNKLAMVGMTCLFFLDRGRHLRPGHRAAQSGAERPPHSRQVPAGGLDPDGQPEDDRRLELSARHRRQWPRRLQPSRLRHSHLARRRLHSNGRHHADRDSDRSGGGVRRRHAGQLLDAVHGYRLCIPGAALFHHHADIVR